MQDIFGCVSASVGGCASNWVGGFHDCEGETYSFHADDVDSFRFRSALFSKFGTDCLSSKLHNGQSACQTPFSRFPDIPARIRTYVHGGCTRGIA